MRSEASTIRLTGLDGKILKLHLVGSRRYVRAVDILTGMQDLTETSGVDVRFLRPVDSHLMISLAKRDKPTALARVYIESLNTPIHLLRDDPAPLSIVEETALAAHEIVTSGDGTIFDFSFAEPPDRSTLLQTVFAQYQQISGQKFTVRRLAAKAYDAQGSSTIRLTVKKPKNSTRGYYGGIMENGKTLFDIWFQPRIGSD